MPTISEFIEGTPLEETIVSNCSKYREKFVKIVDKAGVGDCDIEDKNAVNRIMSISSWNWAGFFLTYYWAIYRKADHFGWIAVSSFFLFIGIYVFFTLFINIHLSFGIIVIIITVGLSILVAGSMYGNGIILCNALKSYANTTSSTDREQRSTSTVVAVILLTIAYFGILYGIAFWQTHSKVNNTIVRYLDENNISVDFDIISLPYTATISSHYIVPVSVGTGDDMNVIDFRVIGYIWDKQQVRASELEVLKLKRLSGK